MVMAGEIISISGALADAHPSPAAASTNRPSSHRPVVSHEARGAPATSTPQTKTGTAGLQKSEPEDKELLARILERAENIVLARNNKLSFERDTEDGRMYLFIRDKNTGEEIFRIPKNYLKNTDPHLWGSHRLDVRI